MTKIVETVRIAEDPDTLWREIGEFGAVGHWHPMLAKVDARLSAARWAAGSAPWATEPSVFLASVRASSGVMVPALASVRRLVGALRPLPARYFTT